jgi:uncharacterized protein YijF (DUF1287 family)
MKRHFAAYPKNWGLIRPDSNIDHRRVPNLATWFKRQGYHLPISQDAAAYQAWRRRHLDLKRRAAPYRHRVGPAVGRRRKAAGDPQYRLGRPEDDALFEYRITGHFRAF